MLPETESIHLDQHCPLWGNGSSLSLAERGLLQY